MAQAKQHNSENEIIDYNQATIEEMDWGEIARLFDSHSNNIDSVYYLLIDIIAAKKLCKDNDCPIFKEVKRIRANRENFKYKTLEDAELKIKDLGALGSYKISFQNFMLEAGDTFQMLLAASTTRETKIYEEQIYHDRNVEIVKILADSKLGVPIEVAKDVSGILKFNSRMGEMSEDTRKYNEELEKKEKKKEEEKEKAKKTN